MLDSLLGRGFVPKGKSQIKLTKNRIDVLRRKRTATIKFLKKDLADLLANGLDVNAYGRAGGLLDELRHLWNLDYVENSCDLVYKHLSIMQKMRECPEDCQEAISSLMFAASRFSEMPELRELRNIFHEKYGDSLELFVNQELVGSFSTPSFSLEKKVKLMEDVASEFSIQWDSNTFQQRMSRHDNGYVKELDKGHGLPNATNDKYKSKAENKSVPKREKDNFVLNGRSEGYNGHNLNRKMVDSPEGVDRFSHPAKAINQNRYEGDQHGISSKERPEKVRHSSRSENKDNVVETSELSLQSRVEPRVEQHSTFFKDADTFVMKVKCERILQQNGHQNGNESELKKREEGLSKRTSKRSSSSERDEKLSFAFKQENFFQRNKQENNVSEHVPVKIEESVSRKLKPSSTSKRVENMEPASRYHNGQEKGEIEIHHGKDKDPLGCNNRDGESKIQKEEADRIKPSFKNALPPPPYVKPNGKARNSSKTGFAESDSVHQDSLKNRSEMAEIGTHRDTDKNILGSHDTMKDHGQEGGIENGLPKRRSSRRRHSKSSNRDDIANPEDSGTMRRRTQSRRREHSERGLQTLCDDEPIKDDEERMIDKLLIHYSQKPSSYDEIKTKPKVKTTSSRKGNIGESNDISEMVQLSSRSYSLPSEHSGPSEPAKVFTRASSFDPDGSRAAKHVHPKLPDYDNLAARFAALKGP